MGIAVILDYEYGVNPSQYSLGYISPKGEHITLSNDREFQVAKVLLLDLGLLIEVIMVRGVKPKPKPRPEVNPKTIETNQTTSFKASTITSKRNRDRDEETS